MGIEVHEVTFHYGKTRVLEDVNLSVADGEVVGILGPNGAGKSTLLRCIAGILRPSRGRVSVDGRGIVELHPLERSRLIGYVPQVPPDSFPFTLFEAVLLGRRPCMGWSPSERDLAKVSETIALLGLEGLASRPVTELSGGERQRVLLAQALAREPRILLLDEPTANLDLRGQLEVLELVREVVRDRGIAAAVVLHDVNLAARFFDRIVLLHRGKVLAEGEPGSVLTTANVRTLYGVEATSVSVSGRPYILPLSPVESGVLPGGLTRGGPPGTVGRWRPTDWSGRSGSSRPEG